MEIDVRRVQTLLAELGFAPGPIDGIRGPLTDAAIITFKKSRGLRPSARLRRRQRREYLRGEVLIFENTVSSTSSSFYAFSTEARPASFDHNVINDDAGAAKALPRH